ncbi:replication initiation and membrane attachment family protein [Neobacillus sp. Marseille-QA0830]
MAQHWQEILPIDRYIVTANGLLHDYDRKVLTMLYQPLIGSACHSLYMTLWAELEENRLWSESSTHHLLMNLLDMNLKDIYQARLKLEGIGLLKSYVKVKEEERSFIYELVPPLNPEQFFLDGMLNIYLYRKIGKKHFARLKRFFSDQGLPNEQGYQDVTKAFQDVFASGTPANLQYLQDLSEELDSEESERFIGRHDQKGITLEGYTFDFDLLLAGLHESLVPRKAINQKVKEVISKLAFLYQIDAIQMKKFIMDALDEHDEIDVEQLRKAARNWYQFENYDQLPSLIERTQPEAHKQQSEKPKTKDEQLVLYFETVSPLKVLRDLSVGGEPSASEIKIVEEVMINQKLLPGVINVLIWYVMLINDMKFTKAYVETIASQWARKQLRTVKEAMEFARTQHKNKNTKTSGKSSNRKPTRTEFLPDWFNEEQPAKVENKRGEENVSDLEAKKREIEEMLKAFDD